MNHTALIKLGVKYTIIYAGLTTVVMYLGSGVFGYAFGAAAMILFIGSLIVAPLLIGTSDIALETAEAGGVAGYQNITNPSQYHPDEFSFPGKGEVVLYLIGLAGYSVISMLLLT